MLSYILKIHFYLELTSSFYRMYFITLIENILITWNIFNFKHFIYKASHHYQSG